MHNGTGKENQRECQRSRRTFLRSVGAAAGGVALLSHASSAGAAPPASSAGSCDDPSERAFWQKLRAEFAFDPRVTHLNTGTVGPMPKQVLARYASYHREFAGNPMRAATLDPNYSFLQENNRARVAQFVGASPYQVVVTSNTTEGMGWVLHGLDFEAGDEVVSTLHEHGAASSPLQILAARRGVRVHFLPLTSPARSSDEILEAFSAATNERTRVWSFCHVNYTTGLRMPVAALCALARERGILTVVDGAHGLGMLDFGMEQLGCDFYAGSGHKWLCGPPGTGVLYVRDGLTNPHGLWPMETEIYGYDYPLLGTLQVRGQQNGPSLRAMADAMDFHVAIGRDRVQARVLALSDYLKLQLARRFGEQSLLSPRSSPELSTGLCSFLPFADPADRFDAAKAESLVQALADRFGLYIRAVTFVDRLEHPGPTTALRVSTHFFNSFADLDDLLAAVDELIRESDG